MSISWHDIAFQLDSDVTSEVAKAWSWLIPEPWEPIICSMVAGVFMEKPSNGVLWLDTGTAIVEQVAKNREDFDTIVQSSPDLVDEWFLPSLVERLHEAGKKPNEGECFGFSILPIFAEGKYDTENMFVLPIREQFVAIADVHRQLDGLPDGTAVQIEITD